MNDAAMQALGSYRGGRMLFLGLGTGLGSTLVWQRNVLPLELGDLPYEGGMIEDDLGKPGLERLGERFGSAKCSAVTLLKLSFIADYVVLGGGNAKLLSKLPTGTELGTIATPTSAAAVCGRTSPAPDGISGTSLRSATSRHVNVARSGRLEAAQREAGRAGAPADGVVRPHGDRPVGDVVDR